MPSLAQVAISPSLQQIQAMGASAVSSHSSASLEATYPVSFDWKSLQSALQRGDITSAQTAFASLQSDLQKSSEPPEHPVQVAARAAQGTPGAQALANLETAVKNGDVQGAQGAFNAVQALVKSNMQPSPPVAQTPQATNNAAPDGVVESPDPEGPSGSALNTVA